MTSPHSIQINVETGYLAEQSAPEQQRYAFAYTITIRNRGSERVQLLSRHWLITDGNEQVQEVIGEGVVGAQPVIEPGKSFTYTSGAVLETSVGTMHGSYHFIDAAGRPFKATIPLFSLSRPGAVH